MGDRKKMKTAVVGCGMISDIYIRNLMKLFDITDLVAISNRSMNKAEEKAAFFGIPKVMTIDEVADDPEIELVVVLTPAQAHYDIIKKMLLKGKHVYTEKMFTTNLEEARELVRIADELKLLIGVAPDTVLGAGTQTAKLALERGMIGEVTGGVVSINRNQCLNSELFTFRGGRTNRCSKEYGLHCMEVLKGIDIAAESGGTYELESTFEMTTLAPGYYSTVFGGAGRGDAELSLV